MFLRFLGLAIGLVSSGCSTATVDERPNVIVVLVDDMGYGDLGMMGGDVQTPTLDRLAGEGVLMTQFYNTAKCSPSRAALLTGRYAHQAGLGGNIALTNRPLLPEGPYQGYLKTDVPILAEMLHAAGYKTYMAGKWHVGEREEHWPRRRGFDRYFGLISGASSYYEIITDQPRERVMADDDTRWMPPVEGFYMTDALADSAAAFIRQHAEDASSPFFLYLAFTAPHWPLHAPEETIAAYDGVYDDGWEALHARRIAQLQANGFLPAVLTPAPMPTDVPAWASLSPEAQAVWSRRMQVHAAMMTKMDAGLGRILDQLEAIGQADNTLILFLSDNGASAEDVTGRGLNDPAVSIGARGSYDAFRKPWAWASVAPLNRYKLNLDEGGIRTPLIAHWPQGLGVEARFTDLPGHLIDLVPTILAAARVTPAADLPGVSLLAHWRNGEAYAPRTLFWEYDGHRAVREGAMKALYRKDEAVWSLYNLAVDPAETNNLAEQEAEQLQALRAKWEAWAEQVGVHDRP